MITLLLEGQNLSVSTPHIVAGTKDYLSVEIIRGTGWSGLHLHVFFKQGATTYELLTDGNHIGPEAHINLSEGKWSISVSGYEYDGDQLVMKITSNSIGLNVAAAPPESGSDLPYIPASSIEQIAAIAQSVRDDADAGVFNGEKGDKGDKGDPGDPPTDAQILSAVDEWFAENPTEVKTGIIADQYSSSGTYDVGDYVWHSGYLYKCTTAITAAEEWTAAHWEAAAVCDDVSEIASEVFTATTETLVDRSDIETSSTGTKNISLNTVIPSGKTCTVTITASETQQMASDIYWRNSSGNRNKIGTIAAGETTVTFVSAPNADATIIRVNKCILTGTYSLVISSSVKQGNVTKNKEAIDKINEVIGEIGKPEPITSIMVFSRGYWSGSTTFSANSYRVGCSTPVTFSKDVVISALNGFYLDGYLGTTRINTRGVLVVPKETPLRLYIRRVWEDTTETADIDEFTTGVVILNYNSLSEYERYAPTFAGIEMFRTAAFLGDSYTATRLGYSWVDIVQNITGVSCTKYAKSGADSGSFITASSYGLPLLLNDPAKDLYWIALGINDGDRVDDNASYLGSISDISGSYEDYPDTFYGNYGHIIEAIQEHAPSAKIVLYKPIFQGIRRTLSGVSATKHGIKDVRDAIDVIAAHYNLPVMDSFDDVLYQSDWYVYHMDSAVSNGTHPAVMLYPAIAKANLRLFSKCVQSNDSYFEDIRYDQ
jgi:lysophospholipase L1-like esterase